MKIDLELKINSGETYLNFWDNENGNDVCCEIRDGKIYEITYEGEDQETQILREISLDEWLEKIKQSNV